MSALHFDATNIPVLGDRTPIPEADYNLQIIAAERKPVKDDPDHSYLGIQVEVIDGEYAGKKIFENINLWNRNPTTVDIAARTVSSICHAINLLVFDDTDQLLHKPFKGHVKISPAHGIYEASNKITSYGTYEGPIGAATPSFGAPAPSATRPVAAVPARPSAPARPAAPAAPARPAPVARSAAIPPSAPAAPIQPPFAAAPSAPPAIPDAEPVAQEEEVPLWART